MAEDLGTLIEKAAAALKAAGAREVYLFGSAAGDRMQEGSDVDMAVAGLPAEKFFHACAAQAPSPVRAKERDFFSPDMLLAIDMR